MNGTHRWSNALNWLHYSSAMPARSYISTLSERFHVKETVTGWLKGYEDFIGLTNVKAAHNKVIQAEGLFLKTQEERRQKRQEITHVQNTLKEIRAELDKTSKIEDRFLHLVTQEHSVIKREKALLEEYDMLEKREREFFLALSESVQFSQKENHSQSERTKYWSLIGSVCGAVIGILGSSVHTWLHRREMRKLLEEASSQSNAHSEISQFAETFQMQNCKFTGLVDDLQSMVRKAKGNNDSPQEHTGKSYSQTPLETLESQVNKLLGNVKHQNSKISQEVNDIKQMINAHKLQNSESLVVYDKEDVERLVKRTEDEIESKMKIHSLVTVASLCMLLVITSLVYQNS